ncbi:LSU ribosomal protein L25P [Salsuginibacillus halophilus]|uniref:Large ribosomal subunit protein bL25 n=1 Tax=Salsuginibacillus halophilus TaxID=517424 RepID=A0A2P8H7P6_9BACI|nr:50S ribosomal protein L25/general stress protein Ctc [Salsuginibacillus halophilus]PSL42255.1 LSU ribosomal protein L25P [Salsuginibacillus halophilus]
MAQATPLEANFRNSEDRAEKKRLRREGFVPGVLYGKTTESKAVSVPNVAFIKTMREAGRNGIVELNFDNGAKHKVIVNDVQTDSLKDTYEHIDFFEVDLTQDMDADVTVNLVGEAPGEKEGGVVSHLQFTLSVRALPEEIPEQIEVDISELNIGDSIFVSDLKSDKTFEFNADPEEAVVTVVPADVPVEEELDTDAAAEPELVGDDSAEETTEDNE